MFDYKLFGHVQDNCIKYGGGYARKQAGCIARPACTYDPQILYNIATDCIYAENELCRFCAAHRPSPGARLDLHETDDRVNYFRYNERANQLWQAFSSSCKLVHADPDAVLATVKAMNRYEKREKWQVCAHLPVYECDNTYTFGDERLRRFWNAAE